MVTPASYEGMSADAYIGKLKRDASSQKRKMSELERKVKSANSQIEDMKTALLKAQEFIHNNDSVIRALQEELAQYRAGGGAQFNETEFSEKLYLANSQADAIISNATARAAEILSSANCEIQPESEKIIGNAKEQADEIIAAAKLEAQNIINSAATSMSNLAQLDENEIVIQAKQRADAIVSDARKVAKSVVTSAKQELELYSNIDDPSTILEHANLMAFDIVEQARISAENISIEANNLAENSRITAEEMMKNASIEAEKITTTANSEVEVAQKRLAEIDKEIQQRLIESDEVAKQRADEIITEAKTKAEEMETTARNLFNEVTTSASAKAVELENAAKIVADRITAEATARAIEIENQAMYRANEIIAQVNSHYNPVYENSYMLSEQMEYAQIPPQIPQMAQEYTNFENTQMEYIQEMPVHNEGIISDEDVTHLTNSKYIDHFAENQAQNMVSAENTVESIYETVPANNGSGSDAQQGCEASDESKKIITSAMSLLDQMMEDLDA